MTNAELIQAIRTEIERNRQAIRVLNEYTAPEQMSKTCAIFQYADSILSELLSFLSTLEKSNFKDFPTTDEEMAKFLAAHPKAEVPEKYKTPDWMFEKSEKPMDLDEQIGSYNIVPYIDDKIAKLQDMWREEKVSFDWDDLKDMIEDVARHFAEWGYLRAAEKYDEIEYNRQRAEEEIPLPEDTVLFNKGVEEGRRLAEEELSDLLTIAHLQGADQMKEQMLKGAVKWTVTTNLANRPVIYLDELHGFKYGDKVRIIILKEEEQ